MGAIGRGTFEAVFGGGVDLLGLGYIFEEFLNHHTIIIPDVPSVRTVLRKGRIENILCGEERTRKAVL